MTVKLGVNIDHIATTGIAVIAGIPAHAIPASVHAATSIGTAVIRTPIGTATVITTGIHAFAVPIVHIGFFVHLHDRRDRLRRHEVRKERNIGETPVERRCALNVVHVVVREEDSDDARRVESRRLHAHPDVAAAYTAVDQEDVASRFDAIRIARAAAG